MLSLCDKIHVLLLSMPESIFDEMPDVIVDERVVRHLAVSPVLHQPEIPQKAQLTGDGGLLRCTMATRSQTHSSP